MLVLRIARAGTTGIPFVSALSVFVGAAGWAGLAGATAAGLQSNGLGVLGSIGLASGFLRGLGIGQRTLQKTTGLARFKGAVVCGKTGTAQVFQGGRRGGDEPPLPYERVDHAWFAGFAPAVKPRIAFAVLVEHGGHGGAVSAPVAAEIVENYYDTVVPPEERNPPRLSRKGERRLSATVEKPGEDATIAVKPRRQVAPTASPIGED